MRQVLGFAPNHPAALSNLAAFMRISGETEGAERLMLESVARQPQNFEPNSCGRGQKAGGLQLLKSLGLHRFGAPPGTRRFAS